jgi:hypothetical protein
MSGLNQSEIIEMAKQAGMRYRKIEDEFFSSYADGVYADDLEAFAKLVAEYEREACAKLCEKWTPTDADGVCDVANAIRERK